MFIRVNRKVYWTLVLLLCACTALAQETESLAALADSNMDENDNA